EREAAVSRGDAPGAGRHLGVELTGAPTRVAQTEQRPARTGAARDRLQDARVVGDREVLVDRGRALAGPVRRVQDEAAALFDGPSVVNANAASAGRHRQAERLQGLLVRDLAQRDVDDEPERPLRAMAHD